MVTYTTTYNLKKPTVADDEDVWGGYLNDSMDLIDDVLDGTTPVTGIDINSGTIDNAVIGGTTPVAGTFTTLTANTSLGVTGNITVSGTVDGRDVAADGTKLDGIESGATADQTKADIDALGINADQVDGLEASQFLRSDANDTTTGNITISKTNGRLVFNETAYATGNSGLSFETGANQDLTILHEVSDGDLPAAGQGLLIASSGTTAATVHMQLVDGGDYYSGSNKVWHAGNDGTGSGLDADTVDGLESTAFIRSNADDNVSGHTEWQDGYSARFGNSADLRIYHNSSGSSYIRSYNHAAGDLYIQGEDTAGVNHNIAAFYSSNAAPYVGLFYDGTEVLTTTSSGVDVTGTVTATSLTADTLTITNQLEMSNTLDMNNYDIYGVDQIFHHGDTNTYIQFHASDQFRVVTGGSERFEVNNTRTQADRLLVTSALAENDVALSGTSVTADPDSGGAFYLTMTGNTTFTFGAPALGNVSTGFIIELTGNGSTVTWPTSVDWAGGTAPDAPASGETDIYVFWTRDGGTTWYGVQSIDAAA